MKKANAAVRAMLALGLTLSTQAGFAANVGSPQAVNIKFYEFWVSPHADCTEMTRVFNDASPSYQNVSNNISFGDVTMANGSYPCIAVKFSDIVQLVPDYTSDNGNCVQGTTYTRDLFRTGDSSTSPDGTVINGSGTNPAGHIENGMYVYLSTAGNNSNSCTDPSSPCQLPSAFEVTGDSTATMVWDFTNGIEDTGGSCSPESLVFRFR